MRKFNITVNGNTYAVEVEEILENQDPSDPPVKKFSEREAKETLKPEPPVSKVEKKESGSKSEPSVSGGIKAPMPGTISDVKVTQGQNVKKGEVLLILEAMKMENELMSPKDGVVKSVHVAKGDSVNTADVLVVIE